MTADEFLAKQQKKIDAIIEQNKPLQFAVRSIMSVQSKRIFILGNNASGNKIGTYSKRPVYISPNANKGLPAFPLKGKSGATKKKNGLPRKTGYFSSYLAYKEAIGRNQNIKTVDLFLTGALARDWANSDVLTNANARKINQNHYIVSIKEKNYVKTKRYGNVFGVSKSEREDFLKVIQFEYKKAIS